MRPPNQKRYGRGRTNHTNHSSSRNTSRQYNRNTSFESNGPNGRLRGTAQQLAEKYQQHARDAAANGDFVLKENYLQHAEYYSRMFEPLDTTAENADSDNQTDGPAEDKTNGIDAEAASNSADHVNGAANSNPNQKRNNDTQPAQEGLYAGQNQQRPRRRRWEMDDKKSTAKDGNGAATPASETVDQNAFKGDMPAFLNPEAETSNS